MTRKPPFSSAKRRYTQPFERDPDSVPNRWRFEERDQEMLVAVQTHEGMLTTCQLEALFFAPVTPTTTPRSAKRSAETRLQYLFHMAYIERLPIQSLGEGRSTIANILGPAGVDFVTARLGIDRRLVSWRPKIVKNKPTTHYHSMLVNDVRIAVERATQASDLMLTNWIGERELKSQRMQDKIPFLLGTAKKSYKKAPDGAFSVEYPKTEYPDNQIQPVGFFLEVDRGTESNAVWAEKVMAYELFRRSGLAERYYGVTNFRILVTVATQKRLENLIKTTSKAEGGSFYWFTLQENVDIFQPWRILDDIWCVPGWEGNYSLRSLKFTPKLLQDRRY